MANILIVDDNETNRMVLKDLVITLGHTPVLAEDGLSALVKTEKAIPDLILLDILMPRMDGYEVLLHLKKDESFRDIPVIMISAINEEDDVMRCIKRGANDYMIKPFDAAHLKAKIGTCLKKKRLHNKRDER